MKRNKWKTVAIIEMVVLIIVSVVGLYGHVIKNIPTFRFISRALSTEDGGQSILARRQETTFPYPITDNMKYYKNLVTDKDSINVLIIGPDVGGSNYDTLMVASISQKDKSVKIINLPRDIYIEYSDEVKSKLKKAWPGYSSIKGIYKINAAHSIGKKIGYKKDDGRFGAPEYDFTADLIQEAFGIYIDDYVFVKPSSFRRVVDYFGGVQIDVPYRMKYSDPTQDLKIDLDKGLQTLNGAQAEGFVRYRQGYDEKGHYKSIGDIERKKNQTTFMKAFINQHMNLKNLGKIITIFNDLDKYITSSIDNPEEAAEYGKVAEKLYKNKFTQTGEEIESKETKIDGIYYLKIKKAE